MILMIPGPIEVSPAVQSAYSIAPPSHLAPHVIEAFGASLEMMREVWKSSPRAQPFITSGSGTLAMEMAVVNLIEPGDVVLQVNTGYFSDRMAEMLTRRGATVDHVSGELCDAPTNEAIAEAASAKPYKAIFATHVDTSTGVRVDAEAIARIAREHGALSVFDGVCATAAERFEMDAWGADVYLTASQKAIGLPAGLALLVASERAMAARSALTTQVPMSLDFHQWLPIMSAYEARGKSYFATPATNMLLALEVSLREILASKHEEAEGIDAAVARHQHVADAMRAAWDALGLELLPARSELTANTLSAIRYPPGVDGAKLLGEIKARGIVVAGGLHPQLKTAYFRVGHMGDVTTRPERLLDTVDAIQGALAACGHERPEGAARAAAARALGA